MVERKTPLKPTRSPRPEDVRDAVRRAEEIHDRLAAKYPGRVFPDSTAIVREDRDTRD